MKYVANDDTEFNTEAECKEYERITRNSFWAINFMPDLTEDRFMQGIIVVNTSRMNFMNYSTELYLEDWCFRHIGRPVEFVMGVNPTRNYNVFKINKVEYESTNCPGIKISALAKIVNNRLELDVLSAISLDYQRKGVVSIKDFNEVEQKKINEIMSVIYK